MSETKKVAVELFAEDILIWLDGQDSANQSLRMSIKKMLAQNLNVPLTPVSAQVSQSVKLPFNALNIPWTGKVGERGAFEMSSDCNNSDHTALLGFLKEHAGGAMVSEGFYYWIFTDGVSIGRKPSNQVRRGKS